MARRDKIHDAVKNALINDGWDITHDPYRISYHGTTLEADMRADRLLLATRESEAIVIEVKSFLQKSFIHEFTSACGQYQAYVILLRENEQSEKVYMAISQTVYEENFHVEAVRLFKKQFDVHLLIVDIDKETIIEWIA